MVWVIGFASPDSLVIDPKVYGAGGLRAGALFFARHLDYFIMT